MIITIDGPAGAGKSSIARQIADRLRFEFLDTGSLYRAATLAVIRSGLPLDGASEWMGLVRQTEVVPERSNIWLDGEEVSDFIRTPEVTAGIRFLADEPEVRSLMGEIQRRYAAGRDIVTEGRDQGSEVFPDAECKIFLTASPEERARRRMEQWRREGRQCTLEEVLEAQHKRDAEDSSRRVGALRPADDAILLMTDGMSREKVMDETLAIIDKRMRNPAQTE